MTLYMWDLFSSLELYTAIDEKLVRRQEHPTLPLSILNYTERATYTKSWNKVTTQCRGLIYNSITGEVVARPFDKFFNADEHGPSKLGQALNGPVEVTDKMDGSLGILYKTGYEDQPYAIATRGSFTSDQAIHATHRLNKYLLDGWLPSEGLTYLFEICYPENRVVLHYGDLDDLILLGARHIDKGHHYSPKLTMGGWPGPRTKIFEIETFGEARALPDRANAEGVVVRRIKNDFMVKLKQEDYVALHRLVFGMNERTVWQLLGEGQGVNDITASLPEEFWDWVGEVADRLINHYESIAIPAGDIYDNIIHELNIGFDGDWSRKDFAERATKTKYPSLMFAWYDNKDIKPMIWKMIRPAAEKAMIAQNEDTA